jgi:steroid 5-alpha reductase family enzyme
MWLLIGTAIAALAVMLVAFAIGVRRGRHDGVDVAWGAGFAVVALTGLILSPRHGSAWLVTVLVVVWGVRLSLHIAGRMAGKPEDPRYVELLGKARGGRDRYALRAVYLTQGVSLWFVALPVLAAQRFAPLTPWALIGVALWLLGFVLESVGDWQLGRFRADRASKGKVLDTGLWRYTRHPNYFGDACVWWGIFALAVQSRAGWLTVLSPLVMTWLLARGTGKPLLEKHMGGRPGYAEYVARTSGFVPRPPRRWPSGGEPAPRRRAADRRP